MTPQWRIRRLIARVARIEDTATRAQLRILRQSRKDILAAIVDAGAFDKFRLELLLHAIDGEITTAMIEAQQAIEAAVRDSFAIGRELAGVALGLDLVGTSPELIQAIVTVTREQVRSVWTELGAALRGIVRRAALGITDPFKAMTMLARLIRDPKTFGRAFWRAEAIVRTEVGRTFEIASQSERERAEKAGVKVGKYWLHSGRKIHPRPEHIRAGEVYGPKSPIPSKGFFVVGGEKMLHPLDPNASAENTVNCGCSAVPVVMEA